MARPSAFLAKATPSSCKVGGPGGSFLNLLKVVLNPTRMETPAMLAKYAILRKFSLFDVVDEDDDDDGICGEDISRAN